MTTRYILLLSALSIALGLAACTLNDEYSADTERGKETAFAADEGSLFRQTAAGKVLTTSDGMTVYTYDNEAQGLPSCYGECAADWPPTVAPANAKAFGELSLLERTDGARQWAYRGKPLHLSSKDKAPGDVAGEDENGLWHVVTK